MIVHKGFFIHAMKYHVSASLNEYVLQIHFHELSFPFITDLAMCKCVVPLHNYRCLFHFY